MYWGLSEALDLYGEYLNAFKKSKNAGNTAEEKPTLKNDEQDSEVDWDFGEENQENTEKPETSKDFIEKSRSDPKDCEEQQESMFDIVNKVEEMKIPDTSKGAIKKVRLNPVDVEKKENSADNFIEPKELSILLFGSGDPRHILQTIAKLYKHRGEDGSLPEIHLYVVDGCIEITARILLLLAVALENPKFFSITGKTHLFMDLYGNSLLRPTSHHYMIAKAKALLKIITDPVLLMELAPMLDLEELKYIERDGLEAAFNFWLPKPGHVFDIRSYWDARNRQLLGDRYDAKNGAFDWDLSMVLKDRQGKQICNQVR